MTVDADEPADRFWSARRLESPDMAFADALRVLNTMKAPRILISVDSLYRWAESAGYPVQHEHVLVEPRFRRRGRLPGGVRKGGAPGVPRRHGLSL
jgi:hypothetical protein